MMTMKEKRRQRLLCWFEQYRCFENFEISSVRTKRSKNENLSLRVVIVVVVAAAAALVVVVLADGATLWQQNHVFH